LSETSHVFVAHVFVALQGSVFSQVLLFAQVLIVPQVLFAGHVLLIGHESVVEPSLALIVPGTPSPQIITPPAMIAFVDFNRKSRRVVEGELKGESRLSLELSYFMAFLSGYLLLFICLFLCSCRLLSSHV